MIPRAARAAVCLAVAAILGLGHVASAAAHALVLEALPRPDSVVPSTFSRVVLRFNSRIEKALSRVWLRGPDGGRLPLRVLADGAPDHLIAPVPALAGGTYALEWQVFSADGHVTRGSFPFVVTAEP